MHNYILSQFCSFQKKAHKCYSYINVHKILAGIANNIANDYNQWQAQTPTSNLDP